MQCGSCQFENMPGIEVCGRCGARLDFARDDARSETDRQAARLVELLRSHYRRLGYDIVEVPLLPAGRRTEFVLERAD